MMEYFKGRVKSYLFIIFWILIGFGIGGLVIENPDYKTGIIATSIGLIIGELSVFLTWMKNKNKNSNFDE